MWRLRYGVEIIRPDCINFEHRHLKPADRQPLFDLLTSHGYLLGYDDWNILAVSNFIPGGFVEGRNVGDPSLDEEAVAGKGADLAAVAIRR